MRKNKINKQGKMSLVAMVILLFTFHFSPFTLKAQEIIVQAPKTVYEGDNFTVSFIVNDNARDFRGPTFKGFSLRAGPQTYSSSSMSFINGQMSSSVKTTFSYTLTADLAGTFTVGSATCTANGKKLSSESFTIKVEKLTQAQLQQRQQQQQQAQRQRRQAYDPWAQQPQPASKIDDNTLFARATVNKTNPYKGEQIIITYKVYSQIPIRQYAIDKLPGNKGFWAEDLSVNQQKIKQYEETINGRQYMVFEIRKGALFAQETGKLTIEPLNLNVLAMVQAQRRRTGSIWDIFDDPFFNMAQAMEYPLHTKPVGITVRSLPSGPDDFSGAVGSFTVKGGLNSKSVKANEAITYSLTISGRGNLMLITPPTPEFPSTFEVYDPQIEDNISRGEGGISGSRTYEWVLIPRSQGKYTIPAYRFVYFDASSAQYVTLTIPAQIVNVDKGKASGGSSKDDVQFLNHDINYIQPVDSLNPIKNKEHAGICFFLSLVAIVLISIITILWGKKHQTDAQDVIGTRKKRATRMARRRLKKAAALLKSGDTNRFYEEIYKALWGCLSDKYSIPLSQLNRESVSTCLVEKQVPETQQESIMKVLQDVDLARFAPGNPEAQKQTIYNAALNMIVGLE